MSHVSSAGYPKGVLREIPFIRPARLFRTGVKVTILILVAAQCFLVHGHMMRFGWHSQDVKLEKVQHSSVVPPLDAHIVCSKALRTGAVLKSGAEARIVSQ